MSASLYVHHMHTVLTEMKRGGYNPLKLEGTGSCDLPSVNVGAENQTPVFRKAVGVHNH